MLPDLKDVERVVAIDPGSQCTGIAIFDYWPLLEAPHWRLHSALSVQIKPLDDVLKMATSVQREVGKINERTQIAIEYPEEQKYRKEFIRQNDIILLAHTTGLILSRLEPDPRRVSRIPPKEWKGGVPKPGATRRKKRGPRPYIIERRCRRLLGPEELDKILLPTATRRHTDVWDAIGLGLWSVHRCRMGCIPHD